MSFLPLVEAMGLAMLETFLFLTNVTKAITPYAISEGLIAFLKVFNSAVKIQKNI
jgi:hypothetical protein